MAATSVRGSIGGRTARTVVAVVAAAALAASVSSCGGAGEREASISVEAGDPGATPSDALARAAEVTGAVETGRMRALYEVRFEGNGSTASATLMADGSFADRGRSSEITMDMGAYLADLASQMAAPGGEAPPAMSMRIIQDGSLMYVKYEGGGDVPTSLTDHWYVTDLAAETGLPAGQWEAPAGVGGGPTAYVESLKGAGATVIDAGRERIDEVEVTRYEGSIDPRAAIDRADPDKRDDLRQMLESAGMTQPMPFVAWIDDGGVLRRVRQTMAMEMGPVSATITTTVDLYDFGAPIVITPPPADQVRDASELTAVSA